MKKILTVLGARPQFIKASVVSHTINRQEGLTEVVVHTGQHFDPNMSDVFFSELGMEKPAYFLDIHGGSHGVMTGRMLAEVEQVLQHEKPDVVLVYGDTNSTLAGALAAVKLHIPVAHVEAGLRSFNKAMPEEINRIVTDRVSDWLFTPTISATQNLLKEGVAGESIVSVGDVMYDVALHHGGRVEENSRELEKLGLKSNNYVLATIHRAENTDCPQRLAAIVDGLLLVASTIPVVWPIHPRTRSILQKSGRFDVISEIIHLIDPVGYLDMVQLEKFAALIATDSGGVQKEAFFHQIPCVTLRSETEWVELVDAGWNRLAYPSTASDVCEAISLSLGVKGLAVEPYGDGKAAEKIVGFLAKKLLA